jgi:hypothetical protein
LVPRFLNTRTLCDAAVGFDVVVVEQMQIVVIDVDRGGAHVRVLGRGAVGGDADGVVEVGDGVVRDDVALAVDFDGVVAHHAVRLEGRFDPLVASRFALAAAPADEAEAIVAADEQVVGDVEIV